MPLYLIRFGYTPEEWANTTKQPEDRREVIGPLAEAVGGKLHGLWYAFGDHDGYALAEAPDNTAIASVVLALTGSGKFRSLSTAVATGRTAPLPAAAAAHLSGWRHESGRHCREAQRSLHKPNGEVGPGAAGGGQGPPRPDQPGSGPTRTSRERGAMPCRRSSRSSRSGQQRQTPRPAPDRCSRSCSRWASAW